MNLLFNAEHPQVTAGMLDFHHRIADLSHRYEWSAVLDLALSYHVHIAATTILDFKPWEEFPESWVTEYCTPDNLRSIKRARTDSQRNPGRNDPNDKTSVCGMFQRSAGCTYTLCNRRHECRLCAATAHGAANCTKKQ